MNYAQPDAQNVCSATLARVDSPEAEVGFNDYDCCSGVLRWCGNWQPECYANITKKFFPEFLPPGPIEGLIEVGGKTDRTPVKIVRRELAQRSSHQGNGVGHAKMDSLMQA